MKTKIFLISLLVLTLFLSGCSEWFKKKPTTVPPLEAGKNLTALSEKTEDDVANLDEFIDYLLEVSIENKDKTEIVEDSLDSVEDNTQRIKKESSGITRETEKIEDNINKVTFPIETAEEVEEIIKPETEIIKEKSEQIQILAEESLVETDIIEKVIEEINKNSSLQIKTITEDIVPIQSSLSEVPVKMEEIGESTIKYEETMKGLEKDRDKAFEEKEKAIREKNEKMHKVLRWVVVGCIVGIGVFGVLAVMYGSRLGLTLAAMCIATMSIAIFVETYFTYVVIGGGILALGLVGLLVYNVILQKKAFSEVVNTVEIAQDNMEEDTRNKLFGGDGETGIMDTIQHPSTMDLVKKEKQKMSRLWRYAKYRNKSHKRRGDKS